MPEDKQPPIEFLLPESRVSRGSDENQPTHHALPRVLGGPSSRASNTAHDLFISERSIAVESVYDLSGAGRDGGGTLKGKPVEQNQILVLEATDGTTLIVRADKLKQDLERLYPDHALNKNGQVNLHALSDQEAAARGLGSWIWSQLSVLNLSPDGIVESAKDKALELLKDKLGETYEGMIYAGASWAGAKALMWTIESRLVGEPGLYHWHNEHIQPSDHVDVENRALQHAAQNDEPILLFVHGVASSTVATFGDLHAGDDEGNWENLTRSFAGRVYGYEHRSFSSSPLESALALAKSLPKHSRFSLITHSQGGLIGDLLCLADVDEDLISRYQRKPILEKEGEFKDKERPENKKLREAVVTEEKQQLRELHLILKEKQFKIDRYIRVAAPASGTTLLSDNFDLFLSSLLSLFNFSINLIPAVGTIGSTVLSAFRRIVLEIAEKRIDPQLIPGIEAMLPNSPLTVLLAQAHRRENIDMAVISGDADGDSGGFLKRIAIMLTDWIIFDHFDNDFVVDTQSMRAGLARRNSTREYYAHGHEVSHIHYFERFDTRRAVYKWITDPDPQNLPIFNPIPTDCDIKLDMATPTPSDDARSGQINANAPIVFYLPGVMGSHLEIRKENQGRSEGDRIWFDPFHLAAGGIEQLSIDKKNVLPEGIFHRYYGALESYLQTDHEVVTFAYDWRRSIIDSAELLAEEIEKKLNEIRDQPQRQVSILAHSMGGLVVRAMMTERADLWDKIVESGGHFVMLGTPNNGSHQMVETLLGKSGAIRQLAMLDFQHDLQEIIDVVADYDGILQLLPHDEFTDSGVEAAEKEGHDPLSYHQKATWELIREENRDGWFSFKSKLGAKPLARKLNKTKEVWAKLNQHNQEGGFAHAEKIAYVYGLAAHTPCGLTHTKETAGKCLHLHGTVQGDGSVSWKSGQLAGLQKDQYWYMPVPHSSLTGTQEYFSAIVDLVRHGKTRQLSQKRPRTRSAATTTYRYDAGPVLQPGAEDLVLSFFGGRPVRDVSTESTLVLDVSVRAMDLRFAQWPVMCGHYLGDSIAGAEYAIDQHLLNGALTQRERLGIYAGDIGTNTIVMNPRNQEQRKRGSAHGAIVLGLGEWDEITTQKLEDATYDATLEYLLHSTECAGNPDGTDSAADEELAINSLLICCNSTKHITIGASIESIVLGVCKANQQYCHNRGKTQPKRAIRKLEFIECYMDTAISAAYAVRELPRRMEKDLNRLGARIVPMQELQFKQGGGTRERLSDLNSATGYWARLMVTDAERAANHCPDECYDHWVSPAIPQKVVDAVRQQLGQSGNDDSKPNKYTTTEAAAERLKYVYLSERARAEAVVQQRQPGLIEALIKKSIQDSRYDSDICRTLFQLMVPVDFKSTARQTEQLLLVLDGYTANLPWEMLQADEEPLAMRMAMVRQLVSTRYRRVVTSSLSKDACVIGNPSTADFYHHFDLGRDLDEDDNHDLPSLGGATREAQKVTESLRSCGYEVERLYPAHPDDRPSDTALDVLNILFKKPYRILMIAAHGESRITARRDGKERTGVVLSDGIMLTAAEIGQMEVVPDLVFLNCCHLAKTDNQPRAYNRLAYSLSRELIEMGVRCVIAAGWAVNDDAALTFSGTFFESFTEGDTFGKAVWKARKKTYDMHPGLNTWGAYQAYGDPNYVLHTDKEDDDDDDNWQPVAPRELEDKLKGLGIDLKQSSNSDHAYNYTQFSGKIQRILNRVPLDWAKRPGIQYMLADLYGSMLPEGFEQAAKAYQQAIIEEDKDCLVPIRALELLGNLESRQAETLSEKAEEQRIAANKNGIEPSVKTKLLKEQKRLLKEAEMLSDNAIKRLKGLLDITHEMYLLSTANTSEQCQTNVERFALLGSAHKRKAIILLRQNKAWKKELQSAIHFYQKGEGVSFDLNFNPYTTINRLQLEGVLQLTHESQIILAEKAQAAARQGFVTSLNFFDGAMAADAMVAIYLLNEEHVQELAGSKSIKEFLVEYYYDSVKDVRYSSKEFNSVTKQLSYLAMFLKSSAKAEAEAEITGVLNKKADVLTAIASALQQL